MIPELVLGEKLVADELVRIGEAHGRLAEGERIPLDLVLVQRLHVGRNAAIALAQVFPVAEPFLCVVRGETELRILRVQALAALTQPDVEDVVVPGAVGSTPVIGTSYRLREIDRHVGELLPGGFVRRRLDARLLEDRLVVEEGEGVQAQRNAPDLAAGPAKIDHLVAEAGDVELLADELVHSLCGAAPGIVGEAARLQLEHVGDVASGHLRADFRPVIGADRLAGYLDAGALGEQLPHVGGAPCSVWRSPPGRAQPGSFSLGPTHARAADGRSAAESQGRFQ